MHILGSGERIRFMVEQALGWAAYFIKLIARFV